MNLTFERGNSTQPRGHAILYFQDTSSPGGIVATYIVILPISVDVSKYIPPMLASQMTGMSFKDFSAFAVPPVPEPVDSLQAVQHLAELRDDDVVRGEPVSTQDPTHAMEVVNELVQQYASLYGDHAGQASTPIPEPGVESGAGVNEVLYQFMNERGRLGELSKLVGTMRFAAERDDVTLLRETEEMAQALCRYLPGRHKVDDILAAARDPSDRGSRLAQLYLDRCYRLCNEDYQAIPQLDKTIQELETGS